ncbi:Annexin D4 [Vitis vinifera]|uniref:Annexin D4 n=1 Tax=Vitis vinifera TaxID=29760 RepID=A0A438C5Z4_VITVI|nr:Annexin D4 [Vitis vinifera]
MDPPNDFEALTKAFSGFGVDEDSMVSILGKWHLEHLESFRKRTPKFFLEDERLFERILWCNGSCILGKGMLIWCMRLLPRVLKHMACLLRLHAQDHQKSLLGARKAYQSLFDQSMRMCFPLEGIECKVSATLVRYEGSRVNEGTARSEATTLAIVVKNVDQKNPIEDDGIVRILTTRSKLHLKAVVKYYKEIYGKNIDEDHDTLMSLKETLQCLCNPQAYFNKVLNDAFKDDVDENTKEALT